MIEVPSGDWLEAPMPSENSAHRNAPVALLEGRILPGIVRHSFTHFHLEFHVVAGRARDETLDEGFWCAFEKLGDHALPSLMKKVVTHAIKHL